MKLESFEAIVGALQEAGVRYLVAGAAHAPTVIRIRRGRC
jgi:hypothetical protein